MEKFTASMIPVDKIRTNPQQPRKEFDGEKMQELAASVRQHGVLQPVLVEEGPNGTYLLQAGERRLRAARMVGLTEIPGIIRPSLNGSGPRERLVLAMVENLQRADMNPIEEATGYAVLKNEHGLSQVEIAHQVGVPVSRVTRMLTLLKLEKQTQKFILDGTLSNDPRVVVSLLNLEKSDQVKVATALAARRAGPGAALEAIARYQEHLRGALFGAEVIPAQRMAITKAGEPNKTQWGALQQLGRVPPWLLVEISARDVCEVCSLRDQASKTTCKGCALVEMLENMIGKANNGGH